MRIRIPRLKIRIPMKVRVPRLRVAIPKLWTQFVACLFILGFSLLIALPEKSTISVAGVKKLVPIPQLQSIPDTLEIVKSPWSLERFGIPASSNLPLLYGLDVQGGTQVTLEADMSKVAGADRATALASVVEVVRRRIDLFGVSETSIRTAVFQNQYRIIAELPGLNQTDTALQLIGQTAQLKFKTLPPDEEASAAAITDFIDTQLTGEQLEKSTVEYDQNTREPVVALQFDTDGAYLFGQLTEQNIGKPIGIFLDDQPVSFPMVNEAIYGGRATITGGFSLELAKTLSTQLNAGALPVPIKIIEQTTIGPTLGAESLRASVVAGLVGLVLVAFFMIFLYGWAGFLAVIGLIGYGIMTIALYKMIPVTLSLPGIAGLMLSIGMAVDANILTFERMKEERRLGESWQNVIRLGFGRSWESIKDANMATLAVCFILFNPLEWGFLHTSGPVRGFALTLALGIFISLFTGVIFSRLLIQLFLAPPVEKARLPGQARKGKNL